RIATEGEMCRNPTDRWRPLLLLLVMTFLCLWRAPCAWTQESTAQARSSLAAAKTQLAHGDLQGAEKILWSVLSSEPNNEEALTLLGIIRGRQQRYLESEAVFRRVLQLNPQSITACINLASALAAQDKFDQAIEQYKQAQILAPGDSNLQLKLARLHVGRGLFAEALSTLDAMPPERLPPAPIPVKVPSLGALGRKSEAVALRSEEHTSELQSPCNLVCRLLLEKKKKKKIKKQTNRSRIYSKQKKISR